MFPERTPPRKAKYKNNNFAIISIMGSPIEERKIIAYKALVRDE